MSSADRQRFLDSMVVSSSGWRGIFGDSEESANQEVAPHKLAVVAAGAYTIGAAMLERRRDGAVIVATDSRPTGALLAKTVMEVLRGIDLPVRYLGISPTPEVLAYTAAATGVSGFIMITASHNPVGHNGIKFGFEDGRVSGGAVANQIGAAFKSTVTQEERYEPVREAWERGASEGLEEIYAGLGRYKSEAEEAYRGKVIECILRRPLEGTGGALLRRLEEGLAEEPLGVVVDYNGGARANSIDRGFLEGLGVIVEAINDSPGQIAHQIVPEGEGLADCKRALEAAHQRDASFRIGYAADNDGDRGNLVFIDPESGEAFQLHAQEVFALASVAELAWDDLIRKFDDEEDQRPPAVVVNGPTSNRIDALAGYWETEVFRAEVGEANVIDRALELSTHRVIIMGEGSNGGNITPPSLVRDPLSTVGAIIKLARTDAFDAWFEKIGAPVPERRNLLSLVRALPAYTTTGAYEERAILRISTEDHDLLKSRYEALLPAAFEERKGWFYDHLGVNSYRLVNYEGTRTVPGPGNRTGDGRGGFKVELLADDRSVRGFVWMRGSKTEPAFRVLADIALSDPALEAELLDWHLELVRKADNQ